MLDRNTGDEHHGEDKEKECPLQAPGVLTDIENLEQKKDQAADQRHDEQGAQRDRNVVGQGLLGLVLRHKTVCLGSRLLIQCPGFVWSLVIRHWSFANDQ